MNFKGAIHGFFVLLFFWAGTHLCSQEFYIYRPDLNNVTSLKQGMLHIRGDYFFHLLKPGTFPSYNDLSGPEDRWNFGFHNCVLFGSRTQLLAQLITHDEGGRRTKFDWHFSFRHRPVLNLVVIIGHDSNHDSDYQSKLYGRTYYLNRNYVGLGIPVEGDGIYFEPFTWFFHHTNQHGHLDYSGDKLKQEYGLRIGAEPVENIRISIQFIGQSEAYFSWGQSFLADLILRVRVFDYLELSLGAGIWRDLSKSRLNQKFSYHKMIWGIAFPF
jgi:hypothetical protein